MSKDTFVADILDPEALAEILQALSLESMTVGRHIKRDSRGWKIGEYSVRRFWIGVIRPFRLPTVAVCVLDGESVCTAIAAVQEAHSTRVVGPFDFGPGWHDPVSECLVALDGWSSTDRISVDGVSYTLGAKTYEAQMVLRFSNPRSAGLRVIQDSLFKTASEIAKLDVSGVMESCLAPLREMSRRDG